MSVTSLCAEEKKELLMSLRRIEGQVQGLQRMINNYKYCVDILTQVAAVRSALKKVGLHILDSHINGCVRDVLKEDSNGEMVTELLQVIQRYTD